MHHRGGLKIKTLLTEGTMFESLCTVESCKTMFPLWDTVDIDNCPYCGTPRYPPRDPPIVENPPVEEPT